MFRLTRQQIGLANIESTQAYHLQAQAYNDMLKLFTSFTLHDERFLYWFSHFLHLLLRSHWYMRSTKQNSNFKGKFRQDYHLINMPTIRRFNIRQWISQDKLDNQAKGSILFSYGLFDDPLSIKVYLILTLFFIQKNAFLFLLGSSK